MADGSPRQQWNHQHSPGSVLTGHDQRSPAFVLWEGELGSGRRKFTANFIGLYSQG